ncbi:lytic transglycosylase domain-containing protein [Alteromonas oceanisediminis]|uniref:lytic transglycosylase domain-containing protein n=1 Tax=Alteromonas oceanisediminis TaxID=2836180 RepID=UPI001BD914A1|nr:lytic transglycosylase domain-containing protein [Alteromonas oceanisediminis]MBT0585934.1 lytic transglycosylase domain-containing protein [Alteromonas oceanisediminis]
MKNLNERLNSRYWSEPQQFNPNISNIRFEQSGLGYSLYRVRVSLFSSLDINHVQDCMHQLNRPLNLYRVFLWVITFGFCTAPLVWAQNQPVIELLPPSQSHIKPAVYHGEQYSAQRQAFAEFIGTLESARHYDVDEMESALAELRGYPLYPYALKHWLLATLPLQNGARVGQFLREYEGQPVVMNVRKRWLQQLMDEGEYSQFEAFYKEGLSAELDCVYLRRTLSADVSLSTLDNKVASLWLVPYSQPKACDPLFRRWRDAGLQTPQRTLKRMIMAVKSNNIKLATWLARSVPSEQKYLTTLWFDAQRSPYKLTRMNRFPNRASEQEAAVFTYAMGKLVWSQVDAVIQAFSVAQQRLKLSDESVASLTADIALSLAVDNHPNAEKWLQRASDLRSDPEVLRWHVATKVRRDDWQGSLDVIQQADPAFGDDVAYQYWQGRSYQQLGAAEQAKQQLISAANQRHYYGFLASAQLKQTPALNQRSPQWDAVAQTKLASMPALQRAYELFSHQRFTEARREWRRVLRSLNKNEKLQAILLAYDWQWFDQAIFGLAQVGYLDDVERRFPIAFSSRINASAQEHQIDPAWAYAIARRESSFMTDAISHAGARGLMQVLPSTAEYITQSRFPYQSLLEPNQNVDVGIKYMRYLLDKVGDNPVLATASYNAGWRRVLDWVPKSEPIPMDIWIETIPYRETRNYVKAVLAYRYIYQLQLGNSSDLFEQIGSMQMAPLSTPLK